MKKKNKKMPVGLAESVLKSIDITLHFRPALPHKVCIENELGENWPGDNSHVCGSTNFTVGVCKSVK